MKLGENAKPQGSIIIALSFILALVLTIMPLPELIEPFRPAWVPMVLIYWSMALPNRIGVALGWLVGLFLDVATGALLGQNALALALLAFLTLQLHQRIRVYPLGQQALSVLMLIALYQILVVWVRGIIGHPPESWLYWMQSLTSMLFWPVVFVVLRGVRRQYKVN
ncbi:MAG: rod shape-determining protein MreD [Gammaproteobacteria bacterium]|nr:rod shape-determining protein MreD [Gammaproteobacteria bacterium]